jgi:alpha-L-fucosidase
MRFTARGGAVYAIFMEWPERESAIASLGVRALPDSVIERVDLLGGPAVEFRRDADALRVALPRGDGFTPAIRIIGRGLV